MKYTQTRGDDKSGLSETKTNNGIKFHGDFRFDDNRVTIKSDV